MEEKVVRIFTVLISSVSGVALLLILLFPGLHTAAVQYQMRQFFPGSTDGGSVMALMKNRGLEKMKEDNEEARKHQIRMELPNSVAASDISFSEDYIEKTIKMSIPGLSDDYFYEYPLIGTVKGIKDIRYDVKNGVGEIEFKTKKIYICKATESGRYLYLDFIRPKDYYDHVVVIDAGHGGGMPGAMSPDGTVLEKDLNLQITKKLKQVFDEAGDESIGVYYTRLKDVNPDFSDRVGLANGLNADVFLSIHINSDTNPGEAYVNGTAVMYHQGDKTGQSKRLAKNCLNAMLKELGTLSKRTIPGDDIYIIRNSKVPVALAEIGFITNEEELSHLVDEDYQRRTAEALHRGILKTLRQMD